MSYEERLPQAQKETDVDKKRGILKGGGNEADFSSL